MAARDKQGRAGAGQTGQSRRGTNRAEPARVKQRVGGGGQAGQRKRGSSRADAAARTWPAASSGAGEAGRAPAART
jgi:hypothetical protein